MKQNVCFDTSVWINCRNYLIEKNEQVPYGVGSPFIRPIIEKGIISPHQETISAVLDEIYDIGKVDCDIIATCKIHSAKLITYDRKMSIHARAEQIQVKELENNTQAYSEIRKLSNKYSLYTPKSQLDELFRFGVIGN